MKYQLSFEVKIGLSLTDAQFKVLNSAVINSEYQQEAKIGGFWYGRATTRACYKTKVERENCYLTFGSRETDKLLKCLEPYGNRWIEDKTGLELYTDLYTILKNAIDTGNALNMHSGVVEVVNGKTRL